MDQKGLIVVKITERITHKMDLILNEKALFKMEILVGTELVVTVLTDIELGARGFQSTGGNHLKALANQGGNSSQSNNCQSW